MRALPGGDDVHIVRADRVGTELLVVFQHLWLTDHRFQGVRYDVVGGNYESMYPGDIDQFVHELVLIELLEPTYMHPVGPDDEIHWRRVPGIPIGPSTLDAYDGAIRAYRSARADEMEDAWSRDQVPWPDPPQDDVDPEAAEPFSVRYRAGEVTATVDGVAVSLAPFPFSGPAHIRRRGLVRVGTACDANALRTAAGAVAVAERGDCTFQQKVDHAARAGAGALVIVLPDVLGEGKWWGLAPRTSLTELPVLIASDPKSIAQMRTGTMVSSVGRGGTC